MCVFFSYESMKNLVNENSLFYNGENQWRNKARKSNTRLVAGPPYAVEFVRVFNAGGHLGVADSKFSGVEGWWILEKEGDEEGTSSFPAEQREDCVGAYLVTG